MARIDADCPQCGYDKFQAQRIFDSEWGDPELTPDGGVRVHSAAREKEDDPSWLIICDNCAANWDVDDFVEAVRGSS